MKVVMRFDTSEIYQPQVRPVIDRFLRGELNVSEATRELGWSSKDFAKSLSGIFTMCKIGKDSYQTCFSIKTGEAE